MATEGKQSDNEKKPPKQEEKKQQPKIEKKQQEPKGYVTREQLNEGINMILGTNIDFSGLSSNDLMELYQSLLPAPKLLEKILKAHMKDMTNTGKKIIDDNIDGINWQPGSLLRQAQRRIQERTQQ